MSKQTEEYKVLDCGCKVPIVNGKLKIDYNNLNLNCQKVWKLYHNGETQSIFQLESFLCKTWSKELKPDNINDAAALVSIVRPGCLNSEDENGKSLAEVFCHRKNNLVEYDKSSLLEELIGDTYQVIIYQESVMLLAKELAGFDGVSQVKLVKGIGKKDADIIFGFEKQFVDGCEKVGKITREQAQKLFDNIKNSARYSFNKCISENSVLEKADGSTCPIKDIAIGDTITSPYGNTIVLDVIDTGIKECFEFTTESGKKIVCTMDHKFLCEDGNMHTLKDILHNNLSIVVDHE